MHFEPRHVAQGTPPEFARGVTKLSCAQAWMNQLGYIFVEQKEFVDRNPAAIAFLVALDATPPFPCFDFFRRNLKSCGHFLTH